jgi:hypothetical protein
VSGIAAKGPMNGASVKVYAANADGSPGALLGEGTTSNDNTGQFSVAVSPLPSGPVLVSVSGGSYTSEYDGKTVTASSAMSAVLDAVPGSGLANVSVTPLTDMVASRTSQLARGGATLSSALVQARGEVKNRFHLGTDPEQVQPTFNNPNADTAPGSDSRTLDQVLVALETLVHSVGAADTDAVYQALSADFSDGKLDGVGGTDAVQFGTLRAASATLLQDLMYTSIALSTDATLNALKPSDVRSYVLNDPAGASSKGLPTAPAGYSCGAGLTLVTDADGMPACWDGTTATNGGQAIFGTYYVCSANNAIVAQESDCPASNIINVVHSSTQPASYTAPTVNLFTAAQLSAQDRTLLESPGALPAWASLGGLNDAQKAQIQNETNLLEALWTH